MRVATQQREARLESARRDSKARGATKLTRFVEKARLVEKGATREKNYYDENAMLLFV
jgi:hypothetical protein